MGGWQEEEERQGEREGEKYESKKKKWVPLVASWFYVGQGYDSCT